MNNYPHYNPPYNDPNPQTFDDQQPDSPSGAQAAHDLTVMERNRMPSMNNTLNSMPSNLSRHQSSTMDDDRIHQQNAQNDLRRQSVPMQFTNSPESMDQSMRRVSMIDFSNSQNTNELSQFAFDPLLGASMDTNMSGQLNDQMQMDDKANNPSVLSIDTQYQNYIDLNTLSNNSAFQSPFDADMNSPFLNQAGVMSMQMDMNMNMSTEDIAAINDMFSAQNFGSPTFASPMTTNFGSSIYGQPQASGGAMSTTGTQLDSTPPTTTSSNFGMQSLSPNEQNYQSLPQATATSGQMVQSTSNSMRPPQTISASSKSKYQPESSLLNQIRHTTQT